MSTLSLRKIKHDSSIVDNITLDSSGNTSIAKRLEIQQDSISNNRIVLRGQPGSSYRYCIDNASDLNVFRVYRENDDNGASGAEYFKLDSAGRITKPYQPFFYAKNASESGEEVEWINPAVAPVTDEQIQSELNRLLAELPKKQAQANRANAYKLEADPMFFKSQRGEISVDEWKAKVEEIRQRYPYPEEIVNE